MSEGGVSAVSSAQYGIPLFFLGLYAALILLLRFFASFLWTDESGWLASFFSFAYTALNGSFLFTLGYLSYHYLMSGKRSRKRALGASARVGRQQAAAVVAALTKSDPAKLDKEESLLTLIDEVTVKLQGIEMALAHLTPIISDETKKRITQFLAYIHSIQSPWEEEARRKAEDEKAKLLALLCDTDPFATLQKHKKSPRGAAAKNETETEIAEPQSKDEEVSSEPHPGSDDDRDDYDRDEEPGAADKTASHTGTQEDSEKDSLADLRDLTADLSEPGTGSGNFGFDLSGLDSFSTGERSATIESEEDGCTTPGKSKEADDLMAALCGGSTSGNAAPFEFGSEFASLTDLSALTASLGVTQDITEEKEDNDNSGTGEVEEDDEWAALEDEYEDKPREKVTSTRSEKEDLLGALAAFDTPKEGGSQASGFSLGDVDLSALSAFATTSDQNSNSGDRMDLSALDSLSSALESVGERSSAFGDLSDAVLPDEAGEDSHATPAKELSYDDFFTALNRRQEPTKQSKAPPPTSTGSLVKSFGSKEDMNLSGMKRSKKKAVRWGPAGKGKPVYQMEDTHYAAYPYNGSEDSALFGVFDGHVGKNAAERAKVLFPEEFAKNLRGHEEATNVGHVLRKTFLSTDAKMIEYDMEGATATAVYIWKVDGRRYIQAANVGDSTAFLCRSGEAVWLSVDHKVNDPKERDRLVKAGMQLSEGQSRINGLAVSRALGDHFVKEHYPVTAEPFVSEPFELTETDDIMIVASDGLWDIVSGQEAYEIVKDMTDPAAMAAKLTETAVKSRLCNDNVTVVVVLL